MTAPTTYRGHDPLNGPDGMDLMLTVYADGHHELALRPGKDRTWETWSPPVALEVAP